MDRRCDVDATASMILAAPFYLLRDARAGISAPLLWGKQCCNCRDVRACKRALLHLEEAKEVVIHLSPGLTPRVFIRELQVEGKEESAAAAQGGGGHGGGRREDRGGSESDRGEEPTQSENQTLKVARETYLPSVEGIVHGIHKGRVERWRDFLDRQRSLVHVGALWMPWLRHLL
jgi:hypothetical protein